ncbi:penicillin-binding transpeptidase domain-containing protein [Streptomyces yaizuensis]|uniref:Penicillin-binding protein 2 n=1 Tax=Streptomyces yaizuensis TaxID=2989713 RepID=A0ABQ5NW85_9ACTN|nr:penicillin-binding transpeptidase domain-containing protein [Streptomyces sp. YSPA8]GLF94638.1 penicillin-binding protein 2 [Streptomyces sp. YSPA8]
MIPCVRRSGALCLLLLAALPVHAARVQLVDAGKLDGHPANRRGAIARYAEPRGEILAGGRRLTASRDTGQQLRWERVYPEGPLYAPVTGFSSQTYGTTMVEDAADAVLSGTDPALASLPLWHELSRGRPTGADVSTTVEPAMQRAAYTGLGGKRGAVVAVEPATGRILTLVSSPSYDPGQLSGTGPSVRAAWDRLTSQPTQPMLNRAIRQTYPPGSAFKIVTAAAALDAGVVTDVDAPTGTPSPYPLPGTRTRLPDAAEGCGGASLAYAIQWSCNTVLAHLGTRVGLAGMRDAVARFGFNDPGLRIPSPVVPSNFDTRMSADQLALSSIGQFNTTATPLQMALVAAAVANGGELRPPYLVDRVTAHGGTRAVSHPRQRPPRRVMSPLTARLLAGLMVGVVERGTGSAAALPHATVGGKTGTAQHGLGNSGVPYAWFISFARAHGSARPAVAVAVVVEDADAVRGHISGGGNAAPVARAVMAAALREQDLLRERDLLRKRDVRRPGAGAGGRR